MESDCPFWTCVLQCEVGHCQRIDDDGSEIRCSECLGPLTEGSEQVHDDSDEDGDFVWVCGVCVAAWQIVAELSEAPEVNNEIPF
jgi:hypothetical protein